MFLFGIGVFALLFFGMLWRMACRWRYLARTYADGGQSRRTIEERSLQSVVLFGLGAMNALKGIVAINLHDAGVSVRVMKPFSLFHAPLFVPYEDITGWKTTWYLDAPSTELTLRRAPRVKIVMPAEQAEWIASRAGNRMTLHADRPPQGNVGRWSFGLHIAHAAFSVCALAYLAVLLLTR